MFNAKGDFAVGKFSVGFWKGDCMFDEGRRWE